MKTEICLFMTVLLVKGQIKLKAELARTSEFVLIAVKSKKANKTNSFVRFLGESTARQSAFGFI